MRLAGAGSADRRVRLLAERLPVRVRRVERVLALLVRVRPLGRVRLTDRVVQRRIGRRVLGTVTGVLARRLREAVVGRVGARLVHFPALPDRARSNSWPDAGAVYTTRGHMAAVCAPLRRHAMVDACSTTA